MTEMTNETAFGEVLGALMRSRGIPEESEQMAALAEKSGLDAEPFLARVNGDTNYGEPLDGLARELMLNRDEMRLLANAYVYEEGRACDVRATLFEQMTVHLDYVACLDEEEHGGSQAAHHIRKALIPFCEVEAALARETV